MTGPTSTGRVSTPSSRASSISLTTLDSLSSRVWSSADLRHDVVVVRVEPLGHFERHQVDPVIKVLKPSGHREITDEGIG